MVNKRLAGWERRRIDGSAGLEIGAWRDRTSVEFDKNATVSEVRTRLFSRYFTLVRELIESGLHSVPNAVAAGRNSQSFAAVAKDVAPALPGPLRRTSPFMTRPVFVEHRSETEMLRYLRRLADRDLALDRTMIPLGSCTMKLSSLKHFSRSGCFAAPASAASRPRAC